MTRAAFGIASVASLLLAGVLALGVPPWCAVVVAMLASVVASVAALRVDRRRGSFATFVGGVVAVVVMVVAAIVPATASSPIAASFTLGCASLWVACLELAEVSRLVRNARAKVEAWLAAGASPGEALVRTRRVARNGLGVAGLVVLPAILTPSHVAPALVGLALAGLVIAMWVVRAAVLSTDMAEGRLPDIPPPEAGTAFRVTRPDPEAGLRPIVYDRRPGSRT